MESYRNLNYVDTASPFLFTLPYIMRSEEYFSIVTVRSFRKQQYYGFCIPADVFVAKLVSDRSYVSTAVLGLVDVFEPTRPKIK